LESNFFAARIGGRQQANCGTCCSLFFMLRSADEHPLVE
jgi:hypothetical protein